MTLVVIIVFSLFLLLLELNFRKQRKIVKLKNEVVLLQKKLEITAKFLCEYSFLHENAKTMINRIRTKDGKLGDDYEQMMKKGKFRLNNITVNLFTKEELFKILGVNIDFELFTQTDRLFLVMLANNIPNENIAAILNTNLNNLKHKKSYLKRKIEQKATLENNFIILLKLFSAKSNNKENI